MRYCTRWHVEVVLSDHTRHADIVGGLTSGGRQWIRANKALIRRLAADADCRTEIEEAIRKDLAGVPVLSGDVEGIELWPTTGRQPGESPRVGFLSASYLPIGGTETFHKTLLPRLKRVVDIAGFVAAGIYTGDGAKLQVPYATGLKAARRLAAYSDIVVAWGLQDLRAILPANRPKVIAVHHADWSNVWSNDNILNQLDLIDEIICVNADVAKNIAASGKPTHWIPNAIDPARIIPSGQQSQLRVQHSIPADAKIVLYGHRLSPEKRPVLAVEVARQLPEDWVMVIAGDGSQMQAVLNAAAGCNRVRIVGAFDSLADWLSISDCFLSLSTFEGFGLSIAEAIAAGLPTVSTPTGIAPGLATTIPVDSSACEWAETIVNATAKVQSDDMFQRFSVARMVSSWAKVLEFVPARCRL